MKDEKVKRQRQVGRKHVDEYVEAIFGADVHAQRVASLRNGIDGVLHAASLGVRAIGAGLASAQGLAPRHAIKQVDRLLSNEKLAKEPTSACWVRYVLGQRRDVFVNFDWTEFDASGQIMLVLGTQTKHGRSTPLLWQTFERAALKGQQRELEDDLLRRLAQVLPPGVRVTVVADRGFNDSDLYRVLSEELGFDYIIRLRRQIHVEAEDGERRRAHEWVGEKGRMRVLHNTHVTAKRHAVPVVVCVQEAGMKEGWYLVSSRSDLTGSQIKAAYGRRFTVEETFRDVKNPRLGLGLKQTVVERCDRRDMLFLLAVLSHALLTLLGQAGQDLGMDRRYLGASRPGAMSLFKQGSMLYDMLPNMKEHWLEPLMKRFDEVLRDHTLYSGILGVL